MIRFRPGLECQDFTIEIANVIHHAAVWARVTARPCTVLELVSINGAEHLAHVAAMHVEIDPESDLPIDRVALRNYLRGALPSTFLITAQGDRVAIDWFPGAQTPQR